MPRFQPIDLSRRTVLTGLASFISLPAGRGQDFAASTEPPVFQSNISQFIIFDPPLAIPAVRLQRTDGKPVELASFRGKAVIVNFWASGVRPAGASCRFSRSSRK
jgi:cytochrome oxidase Cu insertion factor (SCO1/SenC/PrrC family)